MTATNIFVTADAAYLHTDGASMAGKDFIGGYESKTLLLAHLGLAVAIRGSSRTAELFASSVAPLLVDYDAAVATAGPMLRDVLATWPDEAFGTWGKYCDMVIVGWHPVRGPEAYSMWSEPQGPRLAWTPHKVRSSYLTPWTDKIGAEVQRRGLRLDGQPGPAAGAEIMEAQRAVHEGVGCFCEETRVSADGIQVRIVRRWPDKIGECIQRRIGTSDIRIS